MTEKELYQEYQKLTTEEIYDKALQLAAKLNYQVGISSIERNCKNWGKETIRNDLCRFLAAGNKMSEYNLIMFLND